MERIFLHKCLKTNPGGLRHEHDDPAGSGARNRPFPNSCATSETDLESEGIPTGARPAETAVKTSLLERLGWFRDLPLAKKINAIFGTFFAVGLAMSLVLGLGLGELWNRYNASARVQEAVVAAGELQATAGELRYHSVRALYDNAPRLRESRGASEAEVQSQIAAITVVLAEHLPDMEPRAGDLGERLGALRSETDRATRGCPFGRQRQCSRCRRRCRR